MAHPQEGAQNREEPIAVKWVWLWSGLLLAAGAALRLYRLGKNSLWIDEYASLTVARLPLSEIPSAALLGDAFEPPLYFWLLHLTIDLFGDSEFGLRLLSAAVGTLTIPVAALLIKGIGGSTRVAVLGAAFLAVNPLHIWYSQEARPYALLLFVGVGSLVCLLRALRTGTPLAWAGYVGLASLGILTHVVGVVFPLVAWTWAILSRREASVLRRLFAATAGIILLTAPFAYSLAEAVLHAQGTGSPPRPLSGVEIPYTLFTYVGGYSFGPSVRELQNHGAAALRDHLGQTVLGVGAVVILMVSMLRVRKNAAGKLAVLAVLPMAATWIGSALTTKAYNVRYTVPGLVGFVGLVAMGLCALPRVPRTLAITIAAALFLWADAQWFFNARYLKEDSRAAVAWLGRELPPGSIVAVAPGYQTSVLAHYAQRTGVQLNFTRLPDTASTAGLPPPDALLITRLHHVPQWQTLVHSLRREASSLQSVKLEGYAAFLRRQ